MEQKCFVENDYIKYALMIFREALLSENFPSRIWALPHGLVVTVGADKNCTLLFVNFWPQDASNSLCLQDEILCIPKLPQLAKFG